MGLRPPQLRRGGLLHQAVRAGLRQRRLRHHPQLRAEIHGAGIAGKSAGREQAEVSGEGIGFLYKQHPFGKTERVLFLTDY